jgi:phosphoglycerol transferase MdoB-like AlkP superfamily enzyme
MKRKLLSLLAYSIFWLVFFSFARLYFIIIHNKEAAGLTFNILAGTFTNGLKLDVSATAYILVIPMLTLLPSIWIKGDWFRHFVRIYTWIILLISTAIIAGDAELYSYWGFRMDYTPLLYLKTPQEAAASVSTGKIIAVSLVVITITIIFGLLYDKIIDKRFENKEALRQRVPVTLFFLILWGSLIIPIRGGFGLAPINAGTVYFNDDMFANHTAINVVWNVGASYFNRKPSANPYAFGDLNSAAALTDSLTSKRGIPEKVLNNTRPNILIIILESFGSRMVGSLGGDSLTTPNLNRFIEEGIVFSNFYASGNRTDKALPAILDGYPAQPATSIIKEPKKTQSLNSLVKIMNGLGYSSSFWYGGDINFANFKSFVLASGFSQIITMENFDPSCYNSKWGVHDHLFFEALQDSMKIIKEPFFRVILTLSSHEPFDVPMAPVFEGKDELTKFRNSVYYTDRTIGSFIDWAKTAHWWENSLVIFVADHCRRNSLEDLVFSPAIFKIPMLWLGGALNEKGRRIEKLGTQVDIPVTLLNQLDIQADFPFSKDLLSDKSHSFAFYVYNEGFAFITDSSAVIYDQKLGSPVLKTGVDTENTENLGKAYLQVLYDDYMKR